MRRHLNIISMMVTLSIATVSFAQDNPMVGGAPMYAEKNIVENAVNSKDHTTLVAAVKAAGLVDTLSGPGPFTVFAPTNEAFEALPAGTVDTLLKPENKDTLTRVLTAHVVPGKLTAADLTADIEKAGGKYNMTTASGDALTAEMKGGHIYIVDESGGAAEITIPDVEQSNGVIHVVDRVLVPKLTTSVDVRASRIFAGPEDYPPTDFAAYGIVAFPALASSFDAERHRMICEAFINAVIPSQNLDAPKNQQMVTVWPMDSRESAGKVTRSRKVDTCAPAIEHYGLETSLRAIRSAAVAGADLHGRGPFLIAWSPPSDMGRSEAVVLLANFSDVEDYSLASEAMAQWVTDIESNPELWEERGFDTGVIATVRRWSDHYGSMILSVVGL